MSTRLAIGPSPRATSKPGRTSKPPASCRSLPTRWRRRILCRPMGRPTAAAGGPTITRTARSVRACGNSTARIKTRNTLGLARRYALDALQWLIDDGVAARDARATPRGSARNLIGIAIAIVKPDGTVSPLHVRLGLDTGSRPCRRRSAWCRRSEEPAMPFARPTLTALRDQSIEDITTSGVPGLTGLLRNAVLRVLAWVMAGLAYSRLWLRRLDRPDGRPLHRRRRVPLRLGGADRDLSRSKRPPRPEPRPSPATRTTVLRTGNAAHPPGRHALRDDRGRHRRHVGQRHRADRRAGARRRSPIATPARRSRIATAVAGINSGGITSGPTVGGADQETNDALRTRMLFQIPRATAGRRRDRLCPLGARGPWRAPARGSSAAATGPEPSSSIRCSTTPQAAHGGFPQGTDGARPSRKRARRPRAAINCLSPIISTPFSP